MMTRGKESLLFILLMLNHGLVAKRLSEGPSSILDNTSYFGCSLENSILKNYTEFTRSGLLQHVLS